MLADFTGLTLLFLLYLFFLKQRNHYHPVITSSLAQTYPTVTDNSNERCEICNNWSPSFLVPKGYLLFLFPSATRAVGVAQYQHCKSTVTPGSYLFSYYFSVA